MLLVLGLTVTHAPAVRDRELDWGTRREIAGMDQMCYIVADPIPRAYHTNPSHRMTYSISGEVQLMFGQQIQSWKLINVMVHEAEKHGDMMASTSQKDQVMGFTNTSAHGCLEMCMSW